MKKSFTLLAFMSILLFSKEAKCQSTYITQSGFSACITEDYFDKLGDYSVDKDYDAIQKLIDNKVCFFLKEGITVYVEEQRWNGVVEIRPKGQTGTVWTNIEAIKRS